MGKQRHSKAVERESINMGVEIDYFPKWLPIATSNVEEFQFFHSLRIYYFICLFIITILMGMK